MELKDCASACGADGEWNCNSIGDSPILIIFKSGILNLKSKLLAQRVRFVTSIFILAIINKARLLLKVLRKRANIM